MSCDATWAKPLLRMKALALTLSKSRRALYLRVADTVRAAIRAGQVRPGERIPSSRSLAEALHAHRQTVMDALGELVAEGWLVAEPRRGYRVCLSLPDDLLRARASDVGRGGASSTMKWTLARDLRLPAPPPAGAIRHSFRSHPDLRLFPFAELKSCIADSLRRSRAERFGYDDPARHSALAAELETYLRRVRALTGRRILVTHGAQEAIFLVGLLLISPGDDVAVESPGYPPALAAFACAGARVVPIRVDGEGIDPAAFEAAVKRRRPKLLYLTPLHQYPTTVTLPVARRFAIREIAARHGVAILEDDYDHEFHYRSQPLAPMASDDDAGLVIYVSSFSKVLFPSARIGLMAVPEVLYEPLRGIRRVVTHQNDFLIQDALARWMRSGGFERHIRRMRRIYEERRDAMNECLLDARRRGRELEWSNPDGGMAMWVKLPVQAARVSMEAARLGVSAPAEGEFLGSRSPPRFLRLGFSMQTPAELRKGIALLMTAIDR
jgi:GntR family transcriptional regulator / MocR family aminotransferase